MTRFATNLKFNMMKKHYIFLISILFLGSYTSVSQESCEVLGCTDNTACNYNVSANTDDNSCVYAEANYNCDGSCIDIDANSVCDFEQSGCADETACNFFQIANPTWSIDATSADNDSCEFPETNFNCDGTCIDLDEDTICDVVDDCIGDEDAIGVCDGECQLDSDNDGVCDDAEVLGCTDEAACNFDTLATDDDNTCTYPEPNFNCDGTCIDLDADDVCDFVDECPNDPNNDVDNDGVCADLEVDGCTDSTAFNYDLNATEDDDSCVPVILGCMDENACNYNADANTDDSSCVTLADLESNTDEDGVLEICFGCDGLCLDDDGDSVCNCAEILGCTDESAFNYDPLATEDDGSCVEVTEGCLDESLANEEPTGNFCSDCNTFCPDTDGDGVGDCCEPVITGCTDTTACNYNPAANTSVPNDCNYPTPGFDCFGECIDADADDICDLIDSCVGNEINFDLDGDGETDCVACENDDYVPFTCDLDGDGIYECINDEDGEGICDENEIPGCTDATACNYNEDATDDDGSCFDPLCDTDCDEETGEFTDGDIDGDGVCNDDEISGCTDDTAYNFDSNATDDDGSCNNNGYLGDGSCLDVDTDGTCDLIDNCTDNTACNYMDSANEECVFPGPNADCNGCLDGYTDVDGVCKEIMDGCTDVLACNFMPDATNDDGSCEGVVGCDLPYMFNFNPVPEEGCEGADCEGTADCIDNSSCIEWVIGCMNPLACNYNPDANGDDNIQCILPVENCSECGDDGELVAVDSDEDGICNADEVDGCMDSTACNYNADATNDDGSCLVPLACDECVTSTDGVISITVGDTDGDGVCDEDEVEGCTDMLACNFEVDATDDDGSCVGTIGCSETNAYNYTADGYDCLSNAMYGENEWCEDFIPGCMDSLACNYVADANISTPCTYPDQVYLDCDGECLNDCDENGVCDELEFVGCTNPDACNTTYFLEDANGYPVYGTDGTALTFVNPVGDDGTVYTIATIDNGSCLPYGCGLPWAINYSEDAETTGCIDNTLCIFYDLGCTDMTACNYDADANYDDGTCQYPTNGSLITDMECQVCVDANGDGTFEYVDLLDECVGCSDATACNFEELPYTDNTLCVFPGDPCEGVDEDGNVFNGVIMCGDDPLTTEVVEDFYCFDNSSIEEVTETFGLLVYPNPADNIITIELDSYNNVDARVMIINQLGQVVESINITTLSTTNVDVTDYPSGIYQVTVATDVDLVNKSLMIK